MGQPLQRPGHAGIGPSGANKIGEGVELSAALFPYLRAGGVVVRQPGTLAVELIGVTDKAVPFVYFQF